MKHFGKKLLSLGLAAIMLASMLPMGIFSVFAADLDYSQSEFIISNESDWKKISSYAGDFAGKTITLDADINASGLNPLFVGFAGTFNGNNHKIYNVNVNDSGDAFVANYTEAGAVIKNLTVEGALSGASADSVAMLIGTHEGGSLTVSNVTVNASVSATGKYVGGVVGLLRLRDGETATFENVNANVTVTNDKSVATNEMSGTGAVIGMYEPSGKPTLDIKNVNLSGSVSAKASVGGVIGAIFSTKTLGSETPYNNDGSWNNTLYTYTCNTCPETYEPYAESAFKARFTVQKEEETEVSYGPCGCKATIDNYTKTSYNGNAYAGNDNSYIQNITAKELYTGGTVTIANCNSLMDISTDIATELIGAGGVVGTFGGFTRYFGDNFSFDGELNINNCAIGGEIKNTSGATHPISVGGILGAMSYSHATVNVEHCLVTATFPTNEMTLEKGKGAGLIMGGSGCQTMSALNINNTVTTAEEFALIGSIIAKAGGGDHMTGAWLVLNDKNLSDSVPMICNFLEEDKAYYMYGTYPWTYSASVTDSSVVTVTAEKADDMIIKSEDGFIKRIGGQVAGFGIQNSVVQDNQYAIRFIATALVDDMRSAKMTVVVRDASTGKAFKRFEKECKIYDALSTYVNGVKMESKMATEFGAKKFLALTIGEIPAGKAYTFDFTPSYVNASGLTVTGETVSIRYNENNQYDETKNSFDVNPLVTAPTIRIISSNIVTEDPRTYNQDNTHNGTGETYDATMDKGYDDTNIYKGGLNYHRYFRDDQVGETLGRINKKVGTGWDGKTRIKEMANMYKAYQPDFIGLQEVNGSPTIHNDTTYYFKDHTTMQRVLLDEMGEDYEYVVFDGVSTGISPFNPIMYNAKKWKVIDQEIATDTTKVDGMHRWQWAMFEHLENGYQVIVVNIHGHTSDCSKTAGTDMYYEFFHDLNRELKDLEKRNVPIMITGDYNVQSDNTYLTQTLIEGTQMKNSIHMASNVDGAWTDLDHVFVSSNLATVEQLRMISNKSGTTRATDHPSVFADIRLELNRTPGTSTDWNDGQKQ
ncbi:MAG: hypothetical protein J6Q82_05060 [Clostridia bacterium]|nr:hypothetical protein [Clostridia bacterium]